MKAEGLALDITFTATQQQRLIELDAGRDLVEKYFVSCAERDVEFEKIQRSLTTSNRERLHRLRTEKRRPSIRQIEARLVDILTKDGFVEVVTPTLLSAGMLRRMTIDEDHPLWSKVYWVSGEQCLRPMLAPNLYYLMGHLGRLWSYPVKFFEVGSCFRKESKGSRHLSEFTMLNMVEMGVQGDVSARLREMIQMVMSEVGLEYSLEVETSEVYGETVDVIISGDIEAASGAVGPHPLDLNWQVTDNWAGVGFGLERLAMVKDKFSNIRRAGRGLIYLDGARLNI